MRKIEKLEKEIEQLRERLNKTDKLVDALLYMHDGRLLPVSLSKYPSGWVIDVVDDDGRTHVFDFINVSTLAFHPRLKNVVKAKTETAGSVTFDELAKLIVDGKPIKREK